MVTIPPNWGGGDTIEVHRVGRGRDADIIPSRCRARREHLKWFSRLWSEEWLKPRPEPGLDCLMCAELARQRRRILALSQAIRAHQVDQFGAQEGGMRRCHTMYKIDKHCPAGCRALAACLPHVRPDNLLSLSPSLSLTHIHTLSLPHTHSPSAAGHRRGACGDVTRCTKSISTGTTPRASPRSSRTTSLVHLYIVALSLVALSLVALYDLW